VRRHQQLAKSLPQLNLQAAAAPQPAAVAPPSLSQEAISSKNNASSDKPITNTSAKASDEAPSQAAGILQLGQFSSPQVLHTAWQQQLAPACRAAWGALRAETKEFLQQLDAESLQQQQQQQKKKKQEQQEQAWSAGNFLVELDALLGELQEVGAGSTCRAWKYKSLIESCITGLGNLCDCITSCNSNAHNHRCWKFNSSTLAPHLCIQQPAKVCACFICRWAVIF
jgi:hypothetical protein